MKQNALFSAERRFQRLFLRVSPGSLFSNALDYGKTILTLKTYFNLPLFWEPIGKQNGLGCDEMGACNGIDPVAKFS